MNFYFYYFNILKMLYFDKEITKSDDTRYYTTCTTV